ncbi:MAG: EAL domain-containing protein [Pseudomonadota bacterium]
MTIPQDFSERHAYLAAEVLKVLPVGLIVVDSTEQILVWNEWLEDASGISQQQALNLKLSELFPEIKNGRLYTAIYTALETGYPSLLSNSLNNSPLPLYLDVPHEKCPIQQAIQVIALNLPDATRCAVIQISDVTSARVREDTIVKQARDIRNFQQRQNALLRSIPDIAWLKDTQGRYISVNDKFSAVYGMSTQEVEGKTDRDLYPAAQAEHNELTDRAVLESGTIKRYDESIAAHDGKIRWVEIIKAPIFDDGPKIVGIAGVARDITERKATEEKIHFLAHYDTLTEIPNRFMLFERLTQLLAQARQDNNGIAIIYVDLDRFKTINDTLGHTAGDQLLHAVADRLKNSNQKADIVARVGGDEFVLALTDVKLPADVKPVAQEINELICRPYVIDDQEVVITASLGISIFPQDGEDIASLVKNADLAMYRVKQTGRNGYEYFTADMKVVSLDRLTLETGLRHALERNELELHYQSQVDLNTGAIVGAEAQIRWNHPQLGVIYPDRFINIAEETGLIVPIGEWVLTTACRQNLAWQKADLPIIPIAVNLSAVQLLQKNFIAMVEKCLADTQMSAACLDLEITETVIMRDVNSTIGMLDELKKIGVKLSIDDFGIGYSSLSYLKRFPIDYLKIDRSFVRDITTNANDAAITGTIISMAKQLNLTVVAEGVETLDQLKFLKLHKCDQIQGFYLSQPMNSEDFAVHLKNGINGALTS